jgi:hypothetical protein
MAVAEVVAGAAGEMNRRGRIFFELWWGRMELW